MDRASGSARSTDLLSWPQYVALPSDIRKRFPAARLGQALAHRWLIEDCTLPDDSRELAEPWVPAWAARIWVDWRPSDELPRSELLAWMHVCREHLWDNQPGLYDLLLEDDCLISRCSDAALAMIRLCEAGQDMCEAWEDVAARFLTRRPGEEGEDEGPDVAEPRLGLQLMQEAWALHSLILSLPERGADEGVELH